MKSDLLIIAYYLSVGPWATLLGFKYQLCLSIVQTLDSK